MSVVHLLQESFNAGELSPLMGGRPSAPSYPNGCSKMVNFIPRVQGGAFKRPGMQYLGDGKTETVRLYPFRRSTSTNYMLEFNPGCIRIWEGGDVPKLVKVPIGIPNLITGASGGAWASGVSYVAGIKRTNNGIVFYCKSNHTSTSFSEPGVGASWALYWGQVPGYKVGDMVKVDVGSYEDYYVCIADDPLAVGPDDSTKWYYIQGNLWSRPPMEIPTPYLEEELFELQFCQLNDILFIAHPNHPPKRVSRLPESRWVIENVPFQFAPALDVNETRINVQVQFDGVPPFGMPWATATDYQTGDRVHGTGAGVVGRVYQCILGHTSSAAGGGGNEPGIGGSSGTYWTLISSTGYAGGDRVTAVGNGSTVNPYAGQIFTCHTAYNPGSTANDEPGLGSAWQNFWNEGTSSVKIPLWANKTAYVQGQKVRRGKAIYECTRAHTSALNGKPIRPGGSYQKGNSPGDSDLWARVWKVSAADTDLSGLSFALFATEDLFTADDIGTTWLLELGSGGNYEQISVPAGGNTASTENYPLFVQGGFLVTSTWNGGDAMRGTITVQESLDGVIWSTIKQFTQTNKGDGNISYSGEAPTTGAWYRLVAAATDNSDVTTKLKIEATSAVIKLPFKITGLDGTTPATKALGNLVMPKDQLPPALIMGTSTPLWRRPAFSPQDGYPSAVAFHDSRIWWGGTRNYPARMWASQTEDYYNFLTGALDTDGLDLTLAAVESNAIQWMASFNRSLVIGTTGDEWTVDSGETDEALKPSNVRARRRTRFGSGRIAPLLTGDALIWAQRGASRLREFTYIFQKDGFDAPDLSVLAEHIMYQPIQQMAYQTSPESILWATDGLGLYSFTYNREHSVTAWARQGISNGLVKSVAVMYGETDAADEVWAHLSPGMVNTQSAICRLHPETFRFFFGPSSVVSPMDESSCFLDLSVYRTGIYNSETGTTDFTGVNHLSDSVEILFFNGVEVYSSVSFVPRESGLTDDSVVSFAGNITGKSGWVGMRFTSELWTMDLSFPLRNGTSQGRTMQCARTDLCLFKSMGGSVGPVQWNHGSVFDGLGEIEANEIEYTTINTQQAFRSFTGKTGTQHVNSGWRPNLRIGVRSAEPTPFNLLNMVMKVEVREE